MQSRTCKPASGTEYTETLGFFASDGGSGKPPTYNREGGRLAFKLPFGEPSLVLEGDKLTATVEHQFVDYWERVR
jgi:hypothetical protein